MLRERRREGVRTWDQTAAGTGREEAEAEEAGGGRERQPAHSWDTAPL